MSFSSSYVEHSSDDAPSQKLSDAGLYLGSVTFLKGYTYKFLLHLLNSDDHIPDTWKIIQESSSTMRKAARYVLTIGSCSHNNLKDDMIIMGYNSNQIVGGGFFMVSPVSFYGETFLGSSDPLIAPQAIYTPYLESDIFKKAILQAAEAAECPCEYVLLPPHENENLYQIPPHADEKVLKHWLQYVDVQVKEEEPNFKE